MILTSVTPSAAWPAEAYRDIFENAVRTLPAPLQQLFGDMEPVFGQQCEAGDPEVKAGDPEVIETAAALAIQELSSPQGDLGSAVAALRDLGCATAALNDLGDADMDALVLAQKDKFAVVFYGWHPLIREGNLLGYLELRNRDHQQIKDRFGRTSELPSLSGQVELSPEFGLASIAFSHAITDVANVWMYVWASVNGALE